MAASVGFTPARAAAGGGGGAAAPLGARLFCEERTTTTGDTPALKTVPHGAPNPPGWTVTGSE